MKKWGFLFVVFLVMACGGDDGPPPPPEAVRLVFPDENSECNTGVEVSATMSRVEFQWQPSAHTDTYTLNVRNLDSDESFDPIITENTTASVTIEKGAPFSWSVTSRNGRSEEIATSATWLFYNAGSQTTHPPFPAQIIEPASGATIGANTSNQISLLWSGADVENDIATYEVYFSDQNPPETLVTTISSGSTEFNVDVVPDTVYYWRIVTIDGEGNSSDSGVFDFKTL